MKNNPDTCAIPCFKGELVARIKRSMPDSRRLQMLAHLFGLLADPTRLRLFAALAGGEELCVCDLAHVAGLSISATSHQLRRLRDARLVTCRNDGRMAYYLVGSPLPADLIQMAQSSVDSEVA